MAETAEAPGLRKRSSIWSSETLCDGMAHVTDQPFGMQVKTEEDQSMLDQYQVPQ